MTFSKKKTFNRLATASAFIKFEPMWANIDGRPVFALSGKYSPSIPPYHVRSSIDSYGRRYVIIGLEAIDHQQQNIVFLEVETEDGGEDKLFMCYNNDSTGEIRVVYIETSDEQIKYISDRYAQRIDNQASMPEYANT